MVKETDLSGIIYAEEGIYGDRKLYTFLNGFGQDGCMPDIKIVIIN